MDATHAEHSLLVKWTLLAIFVSNNIKVMQAFSQGRAGRSARRRGLAFSPVSGTSERHNVSRACAASDESAGGISRPTRLRRSDQSTAQRNRFHRMRLPSQPHTMVHATSVASTDVGIPTQRHRQIPRHTSYILGTTSRHTLARRHIGTCTTITFP
eukprot:5299301-Prymnesium_polylepis.1